jgi:hypothetical protein
MSPFSPALDSGTFSTLHYGRELNAMERVIGVMLVIVLIGLLADRLLFSPNASCISAGAPTCRNPEDLFIGTI